MIAFIFLINLHNLILNGYLDEPKYLNETVLAEVNGSFLNKTETTLHDSGNIHCYYSNSFSLQETNNIIEMTVYSIIPFTVMFTFNSLIIYKTASMGRHLNRNDARSISSFKKKRHLTISLVSVTFLFLIFTLPDGIYFAFFKTNNSVKYIGILIDHLMFFHHSTLFFILYITNVYFRKAVSNLFQR